ncbi:MAG: membrane integrity-associated transporter subunit PqiC [Planctomycetes bacterium]|nr:membrane integrity-associated transporter subunit PqiC [Planctomycetota bacterium]MCB9871937.1 membrane integrity-associated transporter subunit PqiC [Planctomycetota bacterium]
MKCRSTTAARPARRSRSRFRCLAPAALCCALCLPSVGCRSVAIPEEHYYRLDLGALPAVADAHKPPAGVLRVEGFDVAASLSTDRLLVASTPVQLRAYEFHRWLNPLGQLVRDAVVTGLSRTGAFAEVKSPTDAPGEDWSLSGRIVDFHQVVHQGGGWAARVTMRLRLWSPARGALLLQQELSRQVPVNGSEPAALAAALSEALVQVLQGFAEKCVQARVFAVPGPR